MEYSGVEPTDQMNINILINSNYETNIHGFFSAQCQSTKTNQKENYVFCQLWITRDVMLIKLWHMSFIDFFCSHLMIKWEHYCLTHIWPLCRFFYVVHIVLTCLFKWYWMTWPFFYKKYEFMRKCTKYATFPLNYHEFNIEKCPK